MTLNDNERKTWIYKALKMAYESGVRNGISHIDEECDKIYALARHIYPQPKVLRKPPDLSVERNHLTNDEWKGRVVSWINKNKDKMSLDEVINTLQKGYFISDEFKTRIENEYND